MHHTPTLHLARLAFAAALAAALLAGCESTPASFEKQAEQRTIVADPIRDPDAAEAANREGLVHLDAGELAQAEAAFKRAIESDRTLGPAYNHLGKVYFLRRRYYNAAHQFDKASELMPNHPAPHNNLGLVLYESGKLDESIDKFRKATTLDPSTLAYQANLVRSLVERGDRTEEVIVLLRAVAHNDRRTKWRVWASHQLGLMGLGED